VPEKRKTKRLQNILVSRTFYIDSSNPTPVHVFSVFTNHQAEEAHLTYQSTLTVTIKKQTNILLNELINPARRTVFLIVPGGFIEESRTKNITRTLTSSPSPGDSE
jgi:hypothetical protein